MRLSKLKIAAAQMKFRPAISENVAWIVDTIQTAARKAVDVILFPECAVTGYNCDFASLDWTAVEAGLATIARAARSARCHVLVGCPTLAGVHRSNSLVVFDWKGREIFRYAKIHLTSRETRLFTPGNSLAFFELNGVPATALICHERRYPELVRLPVMMGAQIVFHPNAGLDALEVSQTKRQGRDGIAVRAFENEVYYVFANSVGPQGNDLWSAGDSKIVAPNSDVLALANNRDEAIICAEVDLTKAGRKYACEALVQPAFLQPHWRSMLAACRKQLRNQKQT